MLPGVWGVPQFTFFCPQSWGIMNGAEGDSPLRTPPTLSSPRLVASDLDTLYCMDGIIQVEYHMHNP
jgi:hypothetical protein